MVEKPVFDLTIKHVPSVYGCGDKQFCGAWNSLLFLKLVFFSFSISPILFCSQVIGEEF